MIKWDLFQECKDGSTSTKHHVVIYHINKMKDKSYMVISIDAEKAFDKTEHLLMIKNSQQGGYRGGTSLVVQWLRLCAPNAGGPGLIPGQGTRSHMLQLRVQCHN